MKLSPAGMDLGLGDQLEAETEEQVLARRKKGLLAANQPTAAYGALGLGVGLNNGTGNAGGGAALALLGQGGVYK